MQIAICDDEQRDLNILSSYCASYDPTISVSTFTSGTSLLKGFEDNFFDLVFLDIQMDAPNGMDVGAQLVKHIPTPIIVFTTKSLNYAVQGYGIAMRYLPKPISYDTFSSVMRLALDKVLPTKIKVNYNGTQTVLSVDTILYFEVMRHNITFHLLNKENLTIRGTLTDIITQLSRSWFVQPHKSYCINLDYVDCVHQQQIQLINGDVIPIARDRKDTFQARLKEYIKGTHLS